MKLLIAADMEGISGVVAWDHVSAKHPEYTRFRKMMTADVNAAIEGALKAGADEILVADGHGSGNNILIEDLNPVASLHSGNAAPFAMVQGVGSDVDAAMFIGYHARVGSTPAVLDHTWSSRVVANVWLNGKIIGETGLNAAVCAHYGVPVIMVSGDQTLASEVNKTIPGVETAIVKIATSHQSAQCYSLKESRGRIREASERAVQRLKKGEGPKPYQISKPITVTVELKTSGMVDGSSLIPNVKRLDARRVEFECTDMLHAYHAFRSLVGMTF
ncbi:MAG: M55 family metallopeptidase [Anaerolineaceae bacterium]|nr:M55 family metallopeptidase [Anaerolineaceae bacterium]